MISPIISWSLATASIASIIERRCGSKILNLLRRTSFTCSSELGSNSFPAKMHIRWRINALLAINIVSNFKFSNICQLKKKVLNQQQKLIHKTARNFCVKTSETSLSRDDSRVRCRHRAAARYVSMVLGKAHLWRPFWVWTPLWLQPWVACWGLLIE